MRKRFLGMMGMSGTGALIFLVISAWAVMAQRPRSRPAAAPAPAATPADLKIKYSMTTAGQSFETTTMIKGARERNETHTGYMDMISLTQCDLKRTVQISDKTKKYLITPMDTGDSNQSTAPVTGGASDPSRAGGLITYTTSSVDTGERKEMFGFKARHVKTTMSIESSPDACSPIKQRRETDGWYIDFTFGMNCEAGRQPQAMSQPASRGCQDRVSFKRTGAGRTGYPLEETTTIYDGNGNAISTITKQVVDLSREPLDAALFDLPAGYTETTNSQELYGMPSTDATTSPTASDGSNANDEQVNRPNVGSAKAPGTIRVGVVQINNKTDRPVSTESLRSRLISNIQGSGVEAIPLNAISLTEAEAEAKARQCDFILFTDITGLKTSAAKKLGGLLGRATGVGSSDKTESKVEFKLFAVSETSPRLQSGASAKEEGDEASTGTAVDQEARMVSAEVRKKSR